jgi:hypothetical protein
MLSSDEIQRIVTIAFTLEAISDKDECTTRYVDLPGKPLQDFLLAGINVGKHFRSLAEDVAREGENVEMFRHFVPALTESNRNKSQKHVNFGLLESMFATVSARLLSDSGYAAIDRMGQLIERDVPADVHYLLDARKVAWSTSTNDEKRNYDDSASRQLSSIASFYRQLTETFGEDTSHHQWGTHALHGFPILLKTYNALRAGSDILETIPVIHRSLRAEYPIIRIGILADYSAAAIFLYLYDHSEKII